VPAVSSRYSSAPFSVRQRLERVDYSIADRPKMLDVSRQHGERMRLGDRGDRNVGEARMKTLRRRAAGEHAGDGRGPEVERQDAIAVEMLDRIPPRVEVSSLAGRSFARGLGDARTYFRGRDDRQKKIIRPAIQPLDQRGGTLGLRRASAEMTLVSTR
jgi:hypothetical protein